MLQNPYCPPTSSADDSSKVYSVQFREFRQSSVSFKMALTAVRYRNQIRKEVQEVIQREIGAENIISINESTESLGSFSIIVWYRSV